MGKAVPQGGTMAYTLDEFCAEASALLKSEPLSQALAAIASRLSELLGNPQFVADTFNDEMPPGRRVLHHDSETDFYVLAHVQEGNNAGKPHSHGSSWAIYGNARAFTDMTEWRRINPEHEDHAVLEPARRYRLGPGDTHAYGHGVIHSTAHPEKTWVIRVTGTDLDNLPRYHFGKKDKILEPSRALAS
jgi:hypothetical protein